MIEPRIIQGNALDLPIDDDSVDLIVTSPPYFGLRSYQDNGEHYAGQIGAEATPAEFVDALIAATREMLRVLKPSGSIWVNLGDKYNAYNGGRKDGSIQKNEPRPRVESGSGLDVPSLRPKSLIGIPWRYALRCIDDLGLILRAEIIWSKPNGLPESVTDRARRSHEQWFHFTTQPRYFANVDTIREPHSIATLDRNRYDRADKYTTPAAGPGMRSVNHAGDGNPLGKLPGSVWTVATQPLHVPEHLGIDHFAAFPMEWPRRIIRGWSPDGVCTACGEGRRASVTRIPMQWRPSPTADARQAPDTHRKAASGTMLVPPQTVVTGTECGCPDTTAPTTPAVILDPFGGTGTTSLVAWAEGRQGISVDMSADYCRLARWRTTDPGERARALQVGKPAEQIDGQGVLL